MLGKAVPSDDETPSLLVQVNHIANDAGVRFQTLKLEASGGEEAEASPLSTTEGETVSATEASASLLPLGAAIGPAGLAVMPYSLTFTGDFFKIADFIKGLDSLVKTTNEKVGVDGRLVTINGFSLAEDGEAKFPDPAGDLLGDHVPDAAERGHDRRRLARRAGRTATVDAGLDDDRRRAMKRLKAGPELKMPDLKVPDFLVDLYWDLRDRRLLPLVGLAIVAIVAVPFLLGGGSGIGIGPGVSSLALAPSPGSRSARDSPWSRPSRACATTASACATTTHRSLRAALHLAGPEGREARRRRRRRRRARRPRRRATSTSTTGDEDLELGDDRSHHRNHATARAAAAASSAAPDPLRLRDRRQDHAHRNEARRQQADGRARSFATGSMPPAALPSEKEQAVTYMGISPKTASGDAADLRCRHGCLRRSEMPLRRIEPAS